MSSDGEEAFQRQEPLTFHFGSSNLTDHDIATKSWRRVGKPFCFKRDVIQPRQSAHPPHLHTSSSRKGKHPTKQQGGKKVKATPDSQ